MISSRDDLPAPLAPTRATFSRSPTSNDTSRRTSWPPYDFLIFEMRSMAQSFTNRMPGGQKMTGPSAHLGPYPAEPRQYNRRQFRNEPFRTSHHERVHVCNRRP